MTNISFPEKFDFTFKEEEAKEVDIENTDIVPKSKSSKDKSKAIKSTSTQTTSSPIVCKCEDLINEVNNLYETKKHKEIYDAIVTLGIAKQLLESLNINS